MECVGEKLPELLCYTFTKYSVNIFRASLTAPHLHGKVKT